MRKCKITIEYDGTNYCGWQFQVNGPTIQGEIQKALRRILQKKVSIVGAGRTDRGVHAEGQVAHFEIEKDIPSEKLILAMNSLLPPDISIKNIEEVPLDFHAIFSAKSKVYRYSILNSPYPSALLNRWVNWVSYPLDFELMEEGASFLKGTHDFSSFESSNSPRKTSVRTVMDLALSKVFKKSREVIEIFIEADGFLYNMVRAISGTLIQVGKKRIAPLEVKEILEGRDRKLAGPTADSKGLCMMKVKY